MTYIVRDIERAVCLRFRLTPEQLRGPARHRQIARPRQIAMYLARELTSASFPQIGRHFGRDHTTVLYGARKIAAMTAAEGGRMPKYLDEVRAILATLTPFKECLHQEIAAGARGQAAILPLCAQRMEGEVPVARSRACEVGRGST